jgi:putative Mg2+ transporter-C (MgtC) family protein
MDTIEIFFRLGSALLLGMIIGFERKLVHKEAGMRTYGILAMACATFMLSAVMIGNNFETEQETWRALATVLGAVVTGVGFLGVGLIFYSKEDHARVGLTSSATLLAVAALGATCGLGFYQIAFIAGTLALLTLTVGYHFEYAILKIFGRDDR